MNDSQQMELCETVTNRGPRGTKARESAILVGWATTRSERDGVTEMTPVQYETMRRLCHNLAHASAAEHRRLLEAAELPAGFARVRRLLQ